MLFTFRKLQKHQNKLSWYMGIHTSCMLGNSSNSENTKTPGAEVASWMSFAAAAPFSDLAISRKGSSLAEKLDPSSMAVDQRVFEEIRGCNGRCLIAVE